jgi:uracil-DNA glycosylase family 4
MFIHEYRLSDFLRWKEIQLKIKNCMKCKKENQFQVLFDRKKIPTFKPRKTRILLISEAPPAGKSYFYWENSNDALRKRIFWILNKLGYKIKNLKNFISSGFYLVPTVKCASQKDRKNTKPNNKVIKICINHLKNEIEYIKPRSICLLGRTALYGFSLLFPEKFNFQSLKNVAGKIEEVKIKGRCTKVIISYWPSNRQGKLKDVVNHIKMLCSLT